MPHVRPTARHPESGFILAVVLWTLAALTILVGGIATQINAAVEQAWRMDELSTLQRDMLSTEQSLRYLVSGLPSNAAGLDLSPRTSDDLSEDMFNVDPDNVDTSPTFRFDGTPYSGIGDVSFALQDTSANFALMNDALEWWLPFMRAIGVEENDASRWVDQINDYQDRDELRSLNGAEKAEYEQLGIPGPANRYMTTPHELRNLPFAMEHPALTERLIQVSNSIGQQSANFNTSPAEMIQATYGWSAAQARRFVDLRQHYTLTNSQIADALTGVVVPEDPLQSWLARGPVRIMLGANGRQHRWITVTFNAMRDGTPWVVEHSHPVDLPFQQPDESNAATDNVQYVQQNTERNARARPATSWPRYRTYFPTELSMEQ